MTRIFVFEINNKKISGLIFKKNIIGFDYYYTKLLFNDSTLWIKIKV